MIFNKKLRHNLADETQARVLYSRLSEPNLALAAF